MPARNESADIPLSLQSRLADGYPDLEIVVVDDRSSDDTPEIISAFARMDARVKPVRVDELPHGWLGKVHALDAGVRRATGEWLLFSDADIEVAPGMLAQGGCSLRGERAGSARARPGVPQQKRNRRRAVGDLRPDHGDGGEPGLSARSKLEGGGGKRRLHPRAPQRIRPHSRLRAPAARDRRRHGARDDGEAGGWPLRLRQRARCREREHLRRPTRVLARRREERRHLRGNSVRGGGCGLRAARRAWSTRRSQRWPWGSTRASPGSRGSQP